MTSPFRSEAQAFRFLLLIAAGTVAVIVANAVAGTTVLVVVCVLAAVAVAAAYLVGRPRTQTLPAAPAHVGPPGERRALLLVDDVPDEAVLAGLRERCDRVLVVAPARTSALHHWASDVDQARDQARSRMEDAVSRAQAAHLDVSGVVGDEDPLAAIDDALRTFGGDEVVAATSDPELIGALQLRYAIPVTVASMSRED
jgi:hypothetical protein